MLTEDFAGEMYQVYKYIKMKKIILLFILFFISCSSTKRLERHCEKCGKETKTEIVEETTYEKIDTLIPIPSDFSKTQFTIKCDEFNRPIIINKENNKGKYIDTEIIEKDGVSNNLPIKYITIDCKIDSQSIAFTYFNKNKLSTSKTVEKIPVIIKTELTKLQKFLIKMGILFLLLIIFVAGWKLIKLLIKLKII